MRYMHFTRDLFRVDRSSETADLGTMSKAISILVSYYKGYPIFSVG